MIQRSGSPQARAERRQAWPWSVRLLFAMALGSSRQSWATADLPWYQQPAAILPVHPVHDQPWLLWQRATADAMAGPYASPLFRETACELDVMWRLVDANQDPLPLAAADAELARDLALTGAGMGFGRLVQELADRSETFHVLRNVIYTALSPGLIFRQGGEGAPVKLDTRPQPGAIVRANIDQPRVAPNRPLPPPSLHLGTGFGLVDTATGSAADPQEQPVPAVRAWLDFGAPGRVSARVDARWLEPWEPTRSSVPSWQVAGRLPLPYRFALNVEATGAEETGLPLRQRIALSHPLPERPSWVLRLGGTHLPPGAERETDEWRVDLSLRANLDWNIPVDLDRWPLGQQPGSTGSGLPRIPDASPNRVAPVVRTPAERALDTPPFPAL